MIRADFITLYLTVFLLWISEVWQHSHRHTPNLSLYILETGKAQTCKDTNDTPKIKKSGKN